MSRVINPNRAGKSRAEIVKAIALTLREMMGQQKADGETQDMAAFIVLGLDAIANSIDASVGAWEKRGYWVKADKFRMEWMWAGRLAGSMRQALFAGDWAGVALAAAQVAEKIGPVKVSARGRGGRPWEGAMGRLRVVFVSEKRGTDRD